MTMRGGSSGPTFAVPVLAMAQSNASLFNVWQRLSVLKHDSNPPNSNSAPPDPRLTSSSWGSFGVTTMLDHKSDPTTPISHTPKPVSGEGATGTVAIIALVGMGLASAIVIIALMGFSKVSVDSAVQVLTATAAVIAASIAWITKKDVQTVHHNINSRMDLLLKETQERATAEAIIVERAASAAAIAVLERNQATALAATVAASDAKETPPPAQPQPS